MEKVGIENILKVTGLSCDDLINKLLKYKTLKTSDENISFLHDVDKTINMLQEDAIQPDTNQEESILQEPKNVLDTVGESSLCKDVSTDMVLSELFVECETKEASDCNKSVPSEKISYSSNEPSNSLNEPSNTSNRPSNTSKETSDLQKHFCIVQDFSEESNDSSPGRTTEEIRDAIKEQLRLLRSKKIEPFIQIREYNFERMLSYKRKSIPAKYLEKKTRDSCYQTELQDSFSSDKNPPIPTTTFENILKNNESDIKVVNVCSMDDDVIVLDDDDVNGVEKVNLANEKPKKMSDKILEWLKSTGNWIDTTDHDKNSDASDDKQDVIKPTKTSDIKKIKGWRNKIFEVPTEEKSAENKLTVTTIEEKPDVITTKKEEVNDVYNSYNDPFTSKNLDTFLKEEHLDENYKFSTIQSENFSKIIFVKPVAIKREKTNNNSTKFVNKPRTVAEKRRMEETMKNETTKTKVKYDRNSFLCYNGKRLKISSINPNKHVNIKETVREKLEEKHFKRRRKAFNIFKQINSDSPANIRFNPGPLSKKGSLQINQQDKYKTVVKDLPPVYLEVKPEIGKRVHPNIEPYIHYKTYVMDENRVDFALSVLQDNNKVQNDFFKFSAPYAHNQKLIKLYKRIYVLPINKEVVRRDSGCIGDTVQSVLDDMLNYVSLKEISDSFIRDDEELTNCSLPKTDENDTQSPIGNFEVITNNKLPRSSKTSLELKRLNVKVIEVDIEQDSDNIDVNCKELSCRLGCVCKSLNGCHRAKGHCGNIDCMFKCICNFSPNSQLNITSGSKVILPAGTNLFSNGTVNELEHRAKKDLARVEKEFTQTIIQSKNQTIIVGNSLERKKRITKAPKKLQDFVNPNNVYMVMKKLHKITESYVKLMKIDLNHLVPFCMMHEVYYCECVIKKKQEIVCINDKTAKKSKSTVKRKLTKNSTSANFMNDFISFQPITTIYPDNPSVLTEDNDEPNKKKRKQSFKGIRTSPIFLEESKEPAIQRRKKPTREILFNPTNGSARFFNNIDINQKFVLNSDDFYATDLLKLLTKKYGRSRQFRMLPWKYFSENYYKNHVYLWCHVSNSGKILITSSAMPPEKNMVNVKTRKDLAFSLDFLLWLRTNQLPADKNPNNLHFVLVSTESKKCWEIFGISNISRNEAVDNYNPVHNYRVETATFSKLKLYTADKEDKTMDFVSLPPSTEFSKWKKIRLKSNFSFLLLKRYHFYIKYNILLKMAKESFKTKKTKILYFPTSELNIGVKYGLYAVPEYSDCVFVGPYQTQEDEDFETLRYVNRELVNTDMFDKMLNRRSESKSAWLHTNVIFTHMTKSLLKVNQNVATKSLLNGGSTSNKHFEFSKEMNKKFILNKITSSLNKDIKCYNENLDVHNKKPKYIMSLNVPALGYVQAYVSENSSFIICWPENEKPKVFLSEIVGLQWLKIYLETFLTPLPLTFNIQLIVVNNKPANLIELKFSYIKSFPFVGKLGIVKDIDETSKKIYISQKLFNETELNLSIRHREENILLLECSQIFNELNISQDIKFSTVYDFANCLISLLQTERGENLKFIKDKRSLLKRKYELEEQLKTLTGRFLQHKALVKDKIKYQTVAKQRSHHALNRLRANDEIHIETVDSKNKDKLKFNNEGKNKNDSSEVICIDSDDDTIVTITSPVKTPTRAFVPLASVTNNSLITITNQKPASIAASRFKSICSSNAMIATTTSSNTKLFNTNSRPIIIANDPQAIAPQCNEKSLSNLNKLPALNTHNNTHSNKSFRPNVLRKIDKVLVPLSSDGTTQIKNNMKEFSKLLYKKTIIGDKIVNLKLFPKKK